MELIPDLCNKLSGSFGCKTRRRSLIVRPGGTTRNRRMKFLLPARRTALTVCQAMSMAMTVVCARRWRASERDARVRGWHPCSLQLDVLVCFFPRRNVAHLSKPDGCLNGLDLTKEWASVVKLVMAPMLQKPRGFRSDLSRSR